MVSSEVGLRRQVGTGVCRVCMYVHACVYMCAQWVGLCTSQTELHVQRPGGRKEHTRVEEQQDKRSVSREEVGRDSELSGERVGT